MFLSLWLLSPCRLDLDPAALYLPVSPAGDPRFRLFSSTCWAPVCPLPVWLCWAMKIPLWYLVVLLACLFTPGRSDCQGECVACSLLLQQQQLQRTFNTMVSVCLCVCVTASRRESLLIRASAKCLVNTVVCVSVWVQLHQALMEVCLCLWLSEYIIFSHDNSLCVILCVQLDSALCTVCVCVCMCMCKCNGLQITGCHV